MMIRPYVAILKDSVREAVRSRTLPFLLLFFTLVLAAVAPLGLRDETAWRLADGDLRDVRLLAAKLRRDAAKEGEQPGDRVLAAMPTTLERRVLEPDGDADEEELAADLRDALNDDVLTDETFFTEEAFAGVEPGDRRREGFPLPGTGDGPAELPPIAL